MLSFREFSLKTNKQAETDNNIPKAQKYETKTHTLTNHITNTLIHYGTIILLIDAFNNTHF